MRGWKWWPMVGCAVVASFCISSQPKAQTVNQTITKWGLLGTWSVDCKGPVKEHERITFMIRAGKAVQLRDFGDVKDDSPILAATIAPDQSIELRINFIHPTIKQIRDNAFLRGPDQRIRSKFNRGPDGSYSVFDGKFVPGGNETPWQSRCN